MHSLSSDKDHIRNITQVPGKKTDNCPKRNEHTGADNHYKGYNNFKWIREETTITANGYEKRQKSMA